MAQSEKLENLWLGNKMAREDARGPDGRPATKALGLTPRLVIATA
jgi:hypothetical protein